LIELTEGPLEFTVQRATAVEILSYVKQRC
jgi:hypothetical protein